MKFWTTTLIVLLVFWVLWRIYPEPLARLFMMLERARGQMRRRHRDIGQVRWHYLESGHGEPLVLLHGFNANAHHFCRVSRLLNGHFRVLAPDLPGFGETATGEASSFRVEDLATQVLDWLDALGVRHFYLGGSSMGGYIAVAMARLAPERVRALWLMAPGGLREVKLSAVMEEVAEERHNPLIVRDLRDFQRLTDYCFVHPPWIPMPLQRFLAERGGRRAVLAQRIFDALRDDSRPLEELADQLPTPALVVWGQADQVLNAHGAVVLKERLVNGQVLVLPSIGHLPMIEAPALTAEAWLAFTESLARDKVAGGP